MKIAFISGPFTHEDEIHGIKENINEASKVALKYWRKGYAVICPHKNTSDFQHAKDISHEVWYKGDLDILRRCDVIIMVGRWGVSEGAVREHELAKEIGLEIIYDRRDGMHSKTRGEK